MATAKEYEQKIKDYHHEGLITLWDDYLKKSYDKTFWKSGKLLEYIVLRGFEIEQDGCVTYPYEVKYKLYNYKNAIEQIDGAVHVDELHALVECKDYRAKIKVEPLSKMRNQLAKRHGSLFGMFFTVKNLTTPTQIQVQYMAPQMIIIWTKEDIDYCIRQGKFIECMKVKYRMAVENCEYNYEYYLHDDMNKYLGESLL